MDGDVIDKKKRVFEYLENFKATEFECNSQVLHYTPETFI